MKHGPARDKILCLSSQVVGGPVGNSAAVPAIEALGLTALSVPSVILSNHPGHAVPAGLGIDAATMQAMLAKLDGLGWLDECIGILTGYFTSSEQVAVAAEAIEKMKAARPGTIYLCDPVLGDDHTGIYVRPGVAEAVRDRLVPLADIVTPNRFELGWLTGCSIDGLADARDASARLTGGVVLATSLAAGDGELMTALLGCGEPVSVTTARLAMVPHGTGDLLSGLFIANLINTGGHDLALRLSMAQLGRVLEASAGSNRLNLPGGLAGAADVVPVRVDGSISVAGVDGCRGGWLAVVWDGKAQSVPRAQVVETFSQVLELPATVIAVDIPIGFPERTGLGGRAACVEARKRLGERRSSVFSVPSRAAVMCTDYAQACRVNLEHSDPPRKVSKQCFMLFDKMRQADELMTPQLQNRVFEVHPELAFWAMNGETPLDAPKKVKSAAFAPGLALRRSLLQAAGFPVNRLVRPDVSRAVAGEDDLLDAAGLAWSALRIADGRHITLPQDPPRDGRGLLMEINA